MDTKQYNFSKDKALFELFLRSSKEVEGLLRTCWNETGSGAPYLTTSRVKTEISMAKRCIDQFLGALTKIHEFIPFVIAWYVAEGVDITRVEYFNDFVVLHLRRTVMNKRDKGIALFNLPEKITLGHEYEFCETWILTKQQQQEGEHRCSVRGVAEIQHLLMSLFIFQYVDTYFWDITHVPNLRNVVMEVLQEDVGLEWKQIYQTGERWKRFCDFLT